MMMMIMIDYVHCDDGDYHLLFENKQTWNMLMKPSQWVRIQNALGLRHPIATPVAEFPLANESFPWFRLDIFGDIMLPPFEGVWYVCKMLKIKHVCTTYNWCIFIYVGPFQQLHKVGVNKDPLRI